MEFESEQIDDYSNRTIENFGSLPVGELKIQSLEFNELNETAAIINAAGDSQIDPEVNFTADPPPVEPMTDEDLEVIYEVPVPEPIESQPVVLIDDNNAPEFAQDILHANLQDNEDDSMDIDNVIIEDVKEEVEQEPIPEDNSGEDILVEFTPPSLEVKLDTPQARLKYWIESSFEDAAEFCRIAEINKSSFYEYFSSYSPVIGGQLAEKLERLGLNMDWYKTGKGPMFKELTQPKTVSMTHRVFSVRKKNAPVKKPVQNAEPNKKINDKKIRKGKGIVNKTKVTPRNTNAKASRKPIYYDLSTPQGRLKKWINDSFISVTEFSKVFGSQPSAIYNHTCTNGFIYKKDNLKKLESMGLDVNWYLGDAAVETPVETNPDATVAKVVGIDPKVNVVVEGFQAPKKERKKYAKRSESQAPQAPPPIQSFGTMLMEYETQEVKLLEEKQRIDAELTRIQAIKLHLSELAKLMNF